MVSVVPTAASYTLGISVSSKLEKMFDDAEETARTRLTIRLPSQEFADCLRRKLKHVKNTNDKHVFPEETVTLKKCSVSIILPLCVKKIEVGAEGAILVFDKGQTAKDWGKYSQIWSKKPNSGPKNARLRIPYNWTHSELEKAVGHSS